MEQFSEYEIAQQRIEERQQKRREFYVRLIVFMVIIVISLLGNDGIRIFMIPLAVFAGLLTATKGLELFYNSPYREESNELFELEMGWLFGDDWRDIATIKETAIAQGRIQKRRKERWLFFLHIIVYALLNFVILNIASVGERYNEPPIMWLSTIPLIWLIFLIRDALHTFPPRAMLVRRERKVGNNLRLEITTMQSNKLKHEEKPKRDVRYTIGEDGELVEIEDYLEDEKPKRDML